MIVDLPAPDGPTRAVTVPGCDSKLDFVKDFLAGVVGKIHVFHDHSAGDALHGDGAAWIFVLFLFVQDFAGAFQAGDGFRDLRADGYDLENGSNQEAEEKIE